MLFFLHEMQDKSETATSNIFGIWQRWRLVISSLAIPYQPFPLDPVCSSIPDRRYSPYLQPSPSHEDKVLRLAQ